ncbi:14802_t:CDS:1, partial [Cetraspora pellucida]
NIFEEEQTLELEWTNEVYYEIYTPDAYSIKQRAYRAPSDNQEFLKKN